MLRATILFPRGEPGQHRADRSERLVQCDHHCGERTRIPYDPAADAFEALAPRGKANESANKP